MKKLFTALAITAMAIAGATVVSFANNQTAHANPKADSCIRTNGGINVNEQNANVQVKLDSGCGKRNLVLKSWYAPSASGIPHEEQRLFAQSEPVTVKPSDNGWTKINVKMLPNGCFYQVDLVDVTNPPNNGYPIVSAVTGGNRDCTPKPVYSCNVMSAIGTADRKAVVTRFEYTTQNATLSRVMLTWGDGTSSQINGSANGATHQYAADGNYTIQAVAYFNIVGKNGEVKEKAAKVNPACAATVSFSTPKVGEQQVCDLTTNQTVTIPEGPYDTTKYAPVNDVKCNPVVTPPTPETPKAPEAELVKTGPGAIAGVFGAVSAIAVAGRQLVLRRRS